MHNTSFNAISHNKQKKMLVVPYICMQKKKEVKSNNLIIAILIYEMNVVVKKIKENAFKKNIAFHEKYICMEKN